MDIQLAALFREVELISQRLGGVPRIEREAGQFLNLMIKLAGSNSILEVGTHDGYTTLWLAEAAALTGGAVTTIERDVWQLANAKKLFTRSPQQSRINILQGDPVEILAVLEGPFDFIVFNANPEHALHYFHILAEQIQSGGIIACMNAIRNASALSAYLTYVHERPGLESLLVPVGEGIELTYKTP
jgi:predicted O-methyltransferase YrrM